MVYKNKKGDYCHLIVSHKRNKYSMISTRTQQMLYNDSPLFYCRIATN